MDIGERASIGILGNRRGWWGFGFGREGAIYEDGVRLIFVVGSWVTKRADF